jgi:hypothetical protein
VSAGDEGLHLWIEGQDIWGNPVEDEIIGVELTHDSNPVNEVTGTGQYTCSPAGPGKASCSAGLFRTGDSVVLEARSNGDIRGWGNPVRVTPGAVSEMSVSMATETVSAGEPLEVLIAALDLFGNQQSLSDEDLASLIFTDAHGELECTHDTTADMGPIYRYFCSFYIAGSDNHLSVIATTLAASGTDAPLLVRAGPVHHLDISLSDDVVSYGIVAGNSHVIELVATDEYGNSAEGTETVALSDVGGSLYPATTILEDGTGTETVASTRSIDGNSIWAKVDGVLVGGTGVFDVFHGAAEGLAVELSAAWTFTDTPVVATIDVIDGFGNTVYGDSYDVTIDQGWGDLTNISIDGTESIDLGFPEPGPQVPVVVQSGDWDATSGPLLVGEPCEYPSTFPMEIRGVEDGRICLSASGRAHGELIHRSSTASHWSVQMDDIIVGFGSPSPVGLEWSEPGRSHIRAFVLDEDDCGQEGMVDVYVGEEGQVTGPIAISGSTDTLTAGDPGDEGMADLWAQGYTCSGDLASGASLILQPMLGTTSASEDPGLDEDSLRSTIVLDGHGEAHFGWSMADEDQGGAGEILVGNAAGSAFGMHTLNVVGDAVSPYVWTTSPVGSSDELIDSITIQFSEVMLDPGSPEARAALVELLDPDGMGVVLGGAEWMADRSTLVVGLSAPIDTSAGAWSLTISEDFRDAAGNRLDGDWDGMSGGVWSSQFGSVGTFDSAMTGCSLSTGWFRPDGFDGSGIEADSVQLSGATTAPATWWKLDVFSEGGEHWHRDETLRTGLTSGLMSWDGRDHGGKVVPNGRYLMELVPMDPYRNEGIACIASVVVTNALEP